MPKEATMEISVVLFAAALSKTDFTPPAVKEAVPVVRQHIPRASRQRSSVTIKRESAIHTGSDDWSRVSNCETGNRNITNPSGKFRGYFQFSLGTWHSIGMAGDPLDYSYEQQKAAAIKLLNRDGAGSWPHCGRYLR
jgi:hypothetical protein